MNDALPSRAPARSRRRRDPDNFEDRLRFAGLDPETMPENHDRRYLGRLITMYAGEWRGCPERLCRRHRGCVTPKIRCSNLPPPEAEKGMARAAERAGRNLQDVKGASRPKTGDYK